MDVVDVVLSVDLRRITFQKAALRIEIGVAWPGNCVHARDGPGNAWFLKTRVPDSSLFLGGGTRHTLCTVKRRLAPCSVTAAVVTGATIRCLLSSSDLETPSILAALLRLMLAPQILLQTSTEFAFSAMEGRVPHDDVQLPGSGHLPSEVGDRQGHVQAFVFLPRVLAKQNMPACGAKCLRFHGIQYTQMEHLNNSWPAEEDPEDLFKINDALLRDAIDHGSTGSNPRNPCQTRYPTSRQQTENAGIQKAHHPSILVVALHPLAIICEHAKDESKKPPTYLLRVWRHGRWTSKHLHHQGKTEL